MSEEKKAKVVAENRGKFTIITKDQKLYHWEFPLGASLGENYDMLNLLHEEVWAALEKLREEAQKNLKKKPEENTKNTKIEEKK